MFISHLRFLGDRDGQLHSMVSISDSVWDDLFEMKNVEDCSVCWDPLVSDQIRTSCKHTFHRSCLAEWVKKGTPTCPLCRSYLDRPNGLRGAWRTQHEPFREYASRIAYERSLSRRIDTFGWMVQAVIVKEFVISMWENGLNLHNMTLFFTVMVNVFVLIKIAQYSAIRHREIIS